MPNQLLHLHFATSPPPRVVSPDFPHTSNTPPESQAQLVAEQAWLRGAIITGAGYGIVAALFWLCFRTLWSRVKHKDASRRRNFFFLLYVTVQFILGSLFIGSNSKFTQLAFIDYRGYPGGPSVVETQMFSISADEVSNVAFVLANWLADSLLVWRCVIIYKDFDVFSWCIVLTITGSMQLASYVLGTLFLIQISSPSSSPYNAGHSINWTFPYFTISLAINICITLLITIRLLQYRRKMIQLLGPGHAAECTTVVAMLIESAAIYATFSLLFLIPFVMKNPISYTFLQVLGEAQLIAPLLIIYREAEGKGWISSAWSTAHSTNNDSWDIPIERFTDIQFASSVSHSTVAQELEYTPKQGPSGQVSVDVVDVGVGWREGMELRQL